MLIFKYVENIISVDYLAIYVTVNAMCKGLQPDNTPCHEGLVLQVRTCQITEYPMKAIFAIVRVIYATMYNLSL